MTPTQVLITGGTGFIGSRLAQKCLESGKRVKIYAQINTPAEQDNKKLLEDKGMEVILGSMTDKERIFEAVKGIDIIFHLAAAQHEANVPDQHFWDVNVEGTKNILEASVQANVKKFVHGSTIGVYGILGGVIDEVSPCNPENIYGKTKLEGEKVVLSYNEKIPTTIIRICETYGPGDRRLLKLFRAINKNAFFMIGDGKNLHHLIYIDDLIKAFFLASENEKARGEVFLFAGERPVSTNEMVATIAESLGKSPPKFRAPLFPFMAVAVSMEAILRPLGIQPPLHRRRMDFFKKSFTLTTQKASDLLDFVPEFSFAKGVAETARWYEHEGLLS